MYLENIVWDARDPRRLGRFWSDLLGAEPLTDEPEIYETRLRFTEDFFLDLCFPQVSDPSPIPARVHLDLAGGRRQSQVVDRALELGATHADIGQGDVDWVVLADPEGNAFCVMEQRDLYRDTGPIAAVPIDSADPRRDAAMWAGISGWEPYEAYAAAGLRHPSGRGPVLEFCPEPEPKRDGKNRMHLDVRRSAGEDDALRTVAALGATRLDTAAELPWVVFTDPSGNEFCVLDESKSAGTAE